MNRQSFKGVILFFVVIILCAACMGVEIFTVSSKG